MKKQITFFTASMILLILGSCTSSQFSVSERRVKNGHVYYVNIYDHNRIKFHHWPKNRSISHKNEIAGTALHGENLNRLEEIKSASSLIPLKSDHQLIASSENLPLRTSSIQLIEPHYRLPWNEAIKQSNPSFLKFYPSNYLNRKFQTSDNVSWVDDEPTGKIEGFGLTGFIVSIVGLFVAGIPLGLLAIVFGIIGMVRVGKAPKKRKGKGFGIAAIIIGIIAVVGAIVVMALA